MTDLSVPRDSRRVPLETRVQLKFEKFSGFINEFSANISPGGIFIRSDRPEPVGTLVDFEFRLGDGFELIKGRGEVAWARESSDDPAHPAGMGLSFLEISPQGKELIYKVVDRHVQSGGVPFDPTPPPPVPAPAVTAPRVAITPLGRPAPQEPPIRNADRLLQLFEEATASVEATENKHAEQAPSAPALPVSAMQAVPAPVPAAPAPAEAPPPLERTWTGRAPILAPPPEVPLRQVPSPLDDTQSGGILVPPEPGAAKGKARRSLQVVLGVFLLALVLAGIAAWRVKDIWWDDFFGEPDPEPLPAAFANPERKPMYRSLPGKRALGTGSPTPTVQGTGGAPATAPPPNPAPVQIATAPVAPPVAIAPPGPPISVQSPAPGPPAAPITPPPAAASALQVAPAEAPRPVLAALRSISVRALPNETEVVLEGDGIIRSSNFAQFRIDSGTPRELIRFKGIRHAYPATKVAGGTPELAQIRIGYHSPDELHVVFDLTGPEIVVKSLDVSVSRLTVRLGRKR
ncbi:MAG: TIGR02266 family protein [Acidobacteriota bacterium]